MRLVYVNSSKVTKLEQKMNNSESFLLLLKNLLKCTYEVLLPSQRYTKAIKNHRKICLSSHSCHFVNNNFLSTILLHAYVQYVYIMYTRYQIAPPKAVVGVDRHIKALSMHIQKPLRITKGNNSHTVIG